MRFEAGGSLDLAKLGWKRTPQAKSEVACATSLPRFLAEQIGYLFAEFSL